MKIETIATAVNGIADLRMAQDWDNVGLLVGDANKNIKNILVTIDVTKAVVEEAKKQKADLILSYHPIIWDGLKQVTSSSSPSGESEVVYELIRAGICVYSIHTAYDVAAGGVNDQLADILGIVDSKPIGDYVKNPNARSYKLVTFVPVKSVNTVAGAIHKAGAGAIGNYSQCSFRTAGTGTFKPLAGANPAIGKPGKSERVHEVKLESVVPAEKIEAVVAAMRAVHPYEMPAFDVIRHHDVESKFGLGRIGKLAKPASMTDLIANIKKVTGAKAIGIIGKEKRTVRTAAVCAGSCGKIMNAAIDAGCDLYLTGELKHHMALAAQEAGITCLCLSHTVSERFALKKLVKQLQNQLKDVTIRRSRKDTDPFKWVC
jgi:dinuclear metal center YbgI/SA1388 family protein